MKRKQQKISAAAVIKRIEVIKLQISAQRDELRDLISELAGLEDCADRAVNELESAAEALSEYV